MREYPQMKLRMPPELKDLIEKSSKGSGRSMNAEIVHRLEATFMMDEEIEYAATIRPSMSASMARKVSRQNEELGLPSVISDELNNRIMEACVVGKSIAKLDFAETFKNYPVTGDELQQALLLVKAAYENEGYEITINPTDLTAEF